MHQPGTGAITGSVTAANISVPTDVPMTERPVWKPHQALRRRRPDKEDPAFAAFQCAMHPPTFALRRFHRVRKTLMPSPATGTWPRSRLRGEAPAAVRGHPRLGSRHRSTVTGAGDAWDAGETRDRQRIGGGGQRVRSTSPSPPAASV